MISIRTSLEDKWYDLREVGFDGISVFLTLRPRKENVLLPRETWVRERDAGIKKIRLRDIKWLDYKGSRIRTYGDTAPDTYLFGLMDALLDALRHDNDMMSAREMRRRNMYNSKPR